MAKPIPVVVNPTPVVYADTYWLYVRTPQGALSTVSGTQADLCTQKAVEEALGNTTALVKVRKAV
jgi:hypothetical protein